MVVSQFVNIDSDTLDVMYLIFTASAFVQGMVSAESRKVNRRMDLLFKILKQEREQKNTDKKINKDRNSWLFSS